MDWCGNQADAAAMNRKANQPAPQAQMSRRSKVLIALSLIPAFIVGAYIVLRLCGFVRPFYMPDRAMTPAVSAGDRIFVEGLTFLTRQPRRGDIVAFRTDGIDHSLPSGDFFVKRIAGEPGDHLRISGGKLFINERQVLLSNVAGEIAYNL